MENKGNANKLSWDQSSGLSGKKSVILNSSTTTLTNSISGMNYNEDHASKDEVTEIKFQHVSLNKPVLQMKSIKEKQSVEENPNSGIGLPKKPVLGVYRGKVIQSKVNSFQKAPKSEGEKSSLPDKKFLPPATKPAATSLLISSRNVVLKTIKVTNNPNSVKAGYVLPLQSKPSNKAAINSQSTLKEWQLTSVVAPKKVTENTIHGRVAQPLKAASNNSDHRILRVKKCTSSCEDARTEAPAKPVSVVPGTKSGQNLKTNGNRISLLPKISGEERRACLDEWRASRGKVLKRPPIHMQLGPKSKSKEQGFSSGESLENVFHNEKVNRTLAECLKLTEQGCQSDEVCAMLEDMAQSTPGAKKLVKYWICCIHLEQMGPLEKVIAVYEEAILAGAMPKDELRHTLINIIKNTGSLFEPEDGGAVVESGLREVVEVSGSLGSGASEQVQEASKDLCSDDQKAESDDTKAEASSEMIKTKEMDSDLKPREDILPKKNKKQKTKEGTKKKGKCGTEEQNEDWATSFTPSVNSPEKENGTSYFMRYNQSTTPCLGRVKMHHKAHDSSAKDLKIVTPLRCSKRIREKMHKLLDTVKDQDPCVSSFEQLGELE